MSESLSESLKEINMAGIDKGSKAGFVDFVRKATSNISSAERKELYQYLVQCFMEADVDVDGSINAKEFDEMVERAAAAPRRYGLAPKTSEMFKNDSERFNARKKLFAEMDKDNSNLISLDEWVQYATNHIAGKLRGI